MSLPHQDTLALALSYLSVREVALIQRVSPEVKAAAIVAAERKLASRVASLKQHGIPLLSGLTEDELNLEWYLSAVAFRHGLERADLFY
jgi:hypothetical protein